MENKKVANTRKRFALVFVFLGLIGALVILPYQFRSQAGKAQTQAGQPHTEEIGYFDIRADKKSAEVLNDFRAAQGGNAVQTADQRDAFVRGENSLKQRVPSLKVEYNKELGNPEIIAPDVFQGRAFLTNRFSKTRKLEQFIRKTMIWSVFR